MKKKIVAILIGLIICVLIVPEMHEKISRSIVNHKEAGNFINTEDLNLEKLTMLHWFSKEVQVYSEDKEEVYFVCMNPYNGFTLYKNKKLAMQNEFSKYPKYQGNDYMVFSIKEEDYKDNRVDFYSEVTLDNSKKLKYDVNFFAGKYNEINDLIILKKSIDIVMIILLIISILFLFITNKTELNNIFFIISFLIILYDFKVAIMSFLLSIYFYSNKSIKMYFKLIIFLGCLVYPFDLIKIFIFVLMLLSLYNYYERNDMKSLVSILFLGGFYGIAAINLEFSFFRVFYKDVFLLLVIIYIIINSIIKLKCYFPKENMLKIELLRGISHDFRVPLSTIKLNTELLEKDDFSTELNKENILYIIKEALNDLIYMTSSLTSYISSDSYVHKGSKTNIQDSIENTVNYFLNNKKNIQLETNICSEELYLPIEKVWLNRLIYNLVDNAYKYTDDYGKIILRLIKEKNNIYISIEDNGIGIDEKELSKIIEPFYKIDNSRGSSGLGLGLSIVKSIVENLNGSIKISSKLGVGTKIEIKI